MPVDDLAGEGLMGARVQSHERGEEIVERLPLDLALVGAGDGRDLQEFAEARDRGLVRRGHAPRLRRRRG